MLENWHDNFSCCSLVNVASRANILLLAQDGKMNPVELLMIKFGCKCKESEVTPALFIYLKSSQTFIK